jgi:hypothetical protein
MSWKWRKIIKNHNMKIQVGNKDVLESGSVITFDHSPVTLYLNDSITVRIIFNEIDSKEQTINYSALTSNLLEITCTNFHNSAGVGPSDLVEIGFLHNRKLYFLFRTSSFRNKEDKSLTIHYTFYLGDKII